MAMPFNEYHQKLEEKLQANEVRFMKLARYGCNIIGTTGEGIGKISSLLGLHLSLAKLEADTVQVLVLTIDSNYASVIHEKIGAYLEDRVTTIENESVTNSVVIVTPLILEELLKNGSIDLSNIRTVILDRANALFEHHYHIIQKLYQKLPEKYNTIALSQEYERFVLYALKTYAPNSEYVRLYNNNELQPDTVKIAHVRLRSKENRQERQSTMKLVTSKILGRNSWNQCLIILENAEFARSMKRYLKRDNNLESVIVHEHLSDEELNDIITSLNNRECRVVIALISTNIRALNLQHINFVFFMGIPSKKTIYDSLCTASRDGRLCYSTLVSPKDGIDVFKRIMKEYHLSIGLLPRYLGTEYYTSIKYMLPTEDNIRRYKLLHCLEEQEGIESIDTYESVVMPFEFSYINSTEEPMVDLSPKTIKKFLFDTSKTEENDWFETEQGKIDQMNNPFHLQNVNYTTLDPLEAGERISFFKEKLRLRTSVRPIGRMMETESWTHPVQVNIKRRIDLWRRHVYSVKGDIKDKVVPDFTLDEAAPYDTSLLEEKLSLMENTNVHEEFDNNGAW
eukprot:TRINITY_DN10569_c0_g1_i1.p1 TRINITY_DN10569_c0_g1~~TRINITY_DN10569_c0_g1_i1.p1  ORF type:complete len:567 (-),score=114.15 TRINITY_DN10569_c0_g1_i1:126-1826(-)